MKTTRAGAGQIRGTLLLLECTKMLHACWLVARLDPLSTAELLNLQGKCQPLRTKPAHFGSHFTCFSDHAVSVTTTDGSASQNGVRYTLRGEPVFGVLTGDDHQESAVIVYRCKRGDTEYSQALVYAGTALHPSLLATLPTRNDPLGDVTFAIIGDGTLRLSGLAYAPNDPGCCPSLYVIESYKWNGKSFLLVASHSV